MKPKIGITSSIKRSSRLRLNPSEEYSFLSTKYVSAIVKAGGVPLVLPTVVELIDEFLEVVDGILLSGGGDVDPRFYNEKPSEWSKSINPLRDSFEIELVKRAVKMKLPVLGICRGIQVLNVALGGTLIQDIKNKLKSSVPHTLVGVLSSQRAHLIKVVPGSKLARILGVEELKVNSSHHQAVKELGEGLRAVAHAPDGVIEAVESVGDNYILGVQWHPERILDDIQLRLFKSLIAAAKSV